MGEAKNSFICLIKLYIETTLSINQSIKMVCIPCIVIPVLLWVWHKYIQPYVLMFWNPWAKKVEGSDSCPTGGGDGAAATSDGIPDGTPDETLTDGEKTKNETKEKSQNNGHVTQSAEETKKVFEA